MSSNKICPAGSLHHAYRYESFRAAFLKANGRRTEADHAESCALHFKHRLWNEAGVEV